MSLHRTDAAAISNARAGLFGADVLCGGVSDVRGHRQNPVVKPPQTPVPMRRPELAAAPVPEAAPSAASYSRNAMSTGGSARLWASYAMGRALSA